MRRIAATLLLRCRCVAVGDCGILWDADDRVGVVELEGDLVRERGQIRLGADKKAMPRN